MGRGVAVYVSYTVLCLLSRATGSSAGLWDVDIDLGPAPPAESGPAFSAHASRNRDILPFQIVGIVGAYVGSVLIIGTLLLTLGRRLRKQALTMSERPVEMVKPVQKSFDPSPIVGPEGNGKGWFKRKTGSMRSGRSGKGSLASPGTQSIASFDPNVVEQDRRRQEEDMARLYGHVLDFDDVRTQSQQAVNSNDVSNNGAPPAYPRRERPVLPALHRVQTSEPVPLSPLSPRSPGSPYYAVAPPKDLLAQLSPSYKPPQSPGNRGSTPTTESSPSKLRKNIRKLKIGSPVQGLRDNHDGAREPLSPRLYENVGPPPQPPSARTTETYPYSPTTPGTARSYPFPEEEEDFDDVRDLPNAHPQRPRGLTNNSQPPRSPSTPGLPTSPAQFRVGSPPRRGNTPVGHVDRPLALRQFNEQQKQMQQSQISLASPTAQQFPMSPAGAWNTRPAYPAGLLSPAIHQTVLQTKNFNNGLTTAGGSAVPYSPFFPGVYTTPVTPHFTTRAERKQKEKEEKAIRGAITEEDQVPDESDLWRDGY